jgi:hypothetical protein
MTAADDLRIIAEMAEEIDKRGHSLFFTASLLRRVTTEHGKRVVKLIADMSVRLLDAKWKLGSIVTEHEKEISGLRDEMQRMTDALLEAEKR